MALQFIGRTLQRTSLFLESSARPQCQAFAMKVQHWKRDGLGHESSRTNEKNILISSRIAFVSELLKIRTEEANDLSNRYPRLLTINPDKMNGIIQLLQDGGIPMKDIVKYPDIFTRSYSTLSIRLKLLKSLEVERVPIRMLNCSMKMFEKTLQNIDKERAAIGDHASSLDALATLLKCSLDEVQELVNKHKTLHDSKLSTVKPKIELLINKGVPVEELRNKIWIVGYPYETISERITFMESYGASPVNCKSYLNLLKCPECSFYKGVEKWRTEHRIHSEFGSRNKYLASRLSCSERDITRLVESYPKLDHISLLKLESVLDFLIGECKFSPMVILSHPRAMNYSVRTLRSRYEELTNIHRTTVTVGHLQLDSRQYKKFIDNLI